mgnify:CR=1 FL=1
MRGVIPTTADKVRPDPGDAIMSAPALKTRMFKAAGWLIGSNLTGQLLRLTSNLILTRLLLPEAFGLVAAVNTLYFGLVMFSDLGVWQSVIRSEHGKDRRFLGTAWSVQLLRGLLLFLIVMLFALILYVGAGAGWFESGTVYADPRLPPMMMVFGLTALIQGFESMNLAAAQRELLGSQLARLEILSQFAAMVVTVTLAWLTRSVWSLLIGSVVSSVVRTLMSHFALPGKMVRPAWDSAFAWEIVGFGKWIFLSSIIGFLAANGEKLILGGSLSVASFGIFSIASLLMAAFVGVYSSLNGHVIFSSLSLALKSGDQAEQVRVFAHVQSLADLFLGVSAGVIIMSGQWAVWILYDQRYHAAGWMLQCLGLSVIAIRHQVTEQLMFARGKPSWVSANNALRAIALVVLIPVGQRVSGEFGAILAVALCQFASWPLSLAFKREQGLLTWATERWWLPALAVGLGLGWLVNATLTWIFPLLHR